MLRHRDPPLACCASIGPIHKECPIRLLILIEDRLSPDISAVTIKVISNVFIIVVWGQIDFTISKAAEGKKCSEERYALSKLSCRTGEQICRGLTRLERILNKVIFDLICIFRRQINLSVSSYVCPLLQLARGTHCQNSFVKRWKKNFFDRLW